MGAGYGDGSGGAEALTKLPDVSEDSLPEISMALAGCPPGLAPLYVQQLLSGPNGAAPPPAGSFPSAANASASASAANLAEAAEPPSIGPPRGAGAAGGAPRDYVGQLASLSVRLTGPYVASPAKRASTSHGARGEGSGESHCRCHSRSRAATRTR